MRIRNLTVSNSRLTEGSYHYFRIVKTVALGHDESFFVMQDPLGYKVLMPAKFYEKYGFENGQEIKCRVDRINCSGRMYLEPMHPFYTEGEIYDFEKIGEGKRKNLTGDEENFVWVKDVLGNSWTVRNSGGVDKDSTPTLKCRLDRIKKGKLFLSLAGEPPPQGTLQTGKTYPFVVKEEKINPEDGLKYLILQAEDGSIHVLKKKYYVHYGIKQGDTLHCRVDKFSSEGFFILEPENPWYKVGETYVFKALEIQRLNFSDGTVQNVLVLNDPHGEPVKQFIEPGQVEKVQGKEFITVRVTRIRKSRLEVELI